MLLPLKLTVFFLFGFFFFWIGGKILVNKFEGELQKINPKLVKRAPWIFKIFRIFFKIAALLSLVLILFSWLKYLTI